MLAAVIAEGKSVAQDRRAHTIHRQPLAAILALGQLYAFPQAVSSQRRVSELLQLPSARALSTLLALERLSVASIRVAARKNVSLVRYLRESIPQAPLRLVLFCFLPSSRRRVLRAQTAGRCVVGGEQRLYLLVQGTLVD